MFNGELIHIYGPFSIQLYGICIVIGIVVAMSLALRHPWRPKIISKNHFIDIIIAGTFAGIVGGRILYVINEWHHMNNILDVIALWDGGFSLLGTVIAIPLFLPFYLKKIGVPILPFLDLVSLFAPLLQSISRIGCFLAGCCYGLPTVLPWAIMYTNKQSEAPLAIPLHPTQLYSSISLLLIFFLLYFFVQYWVKKPGQLTMIYLMLISLERFGIDFFRADREFFGADSAHIISIHQYIALAIGTTACVIFIILSKRTVKAHGSI